MPSGDSISRFDSSRDMFNIRTSPVERKIAARNKGVSGKDTIQTQRIQTKRTTPIMILSRSSMGAGGRAVKVARAGRFVFFALALPPFLLLYSIPKWVVVNVIPQMFKQVEKGLDHAKKFFNNLAKLLTEGVGNPFRNILGRIKWRSGGVQKQNGLSLAYVKEKIVDFGALLYRAGVKTAALIKQPFKLMTEKFREVAKAREKLAAKILGESYNPKTDKFVPKLAAAITSKAAAITQPFVNWMIPKVAYVTHTAKLALGWGREKILNGADAIKRSLLPKFKEAQRIYESFQASVAQKTHAFSLQIVQVAQPVINLCIPTMQFLKKHLSLGIGWLKNKPREQFLNMRKKALKFIKGVSPYLNGFYEKSNQQLQKMKTWFLNSFFKFLARLFPFVPWIVKWLVVLIKKLFAVIQLLGRVLAERTRRFHYLVIPIKNRAVSMFNYFLNEVKSLLKAPGAYLLGLIRKVLNFGLKALKLTAIIVIGIGLVFKYWVVMLFELSEELNFWLQARQNSKP
jgi:hypothetical protein